MFMEHYVDHNCSITVHVRDNEWEQVEQWVWDNWDDVVALSFLSYDDSFYELLPYEAIDETEYERRKAAMRPFNPSLLSRYEHEETELDLGDPEVKEKRVKNGALLPQARPLFFYSITIYFFSGTAGFASFFGIESLRIPCLNSPLISSWVTSSPT